MRAQQAAWLVCLGLLSCALSVSGETDPSQNPPNPSYPTPQTRHYAREDAKPYTQTQYKAWYKSKWSSEWSATPTEKHVALDGAAYTVAEFESYYGKHYGHMWKRSREATQQHVAHDGKTSTMVEFMVYYNSSWPEKWNATREAPCVECIDPDSHTRQIVGLFSVITLLACMSAGAACAQDGAAHAPERRIPRMERQNPRFGATPLHFAVWHGDAARTRQLLEDGADPHAVDSDGQEPWAWAEVKGSEAMMEILAEFGAGPSQVMSAHTDSSSPGEILLSGTNMAGEVVLRKRFHDNAPIASVLDEVRRETGAAKTVVLPNNRVLGLGDESLTLAEALSCPPPREQRQARDGTSYTWQQFLKYWGVEAGTLIWSSAARVAEA